MSTSLDVIRGGGGRSEIFLGQSLLDKGIHGMRRVRGEFRTFGLFERPMVSPRGSVFDPASNEVPFGFRERFSMRIGRRHEVVFLVSDDPIPEFTILERTGGEDGDPIAGSLGLFLQIESQVRFSMARVRTVAMEAAVGQDGQNVPTERDWFLSDPGGL